jgi:hypothetical protein
MGLLPARPLFANAKRSQCGHGKRYSSQKVGYARRADLLKEHAGAAFL